MTVFLELVTDAFASTFQGKLAEGQSARRAGTTRARRPLRGLEVKEDTYSLLKVVRANGEEVKLIDSSSPDGRSTSYTNYILQSVQESRMEKHQIVETFGEPYIFFFGESPRFLDVRVMLLNSLDFNWYAEFWENYNRYLRGTKSVEMGARTYLFYDDNIVEGYMLNAAAAQTSEQPLMAELSFRLYVTNLSNVTFVGSPAYPVRASVQLPPGVDLSTADAFTAGAAAVQAADQAAQAENAQAAAALGAAQQAGGFGGGQSLVHALQSGLAATGTPSLDALLANANEAFGMLQHGQRTKPLRGLLADNLDEYTALPPAAPQAPVGASGTELPSDLVSGADEALLSFGVSIGNPDDMVSLGLGPSFGLSAGAGVSLGVSASFGAGVTSQAYAGLRGGLGFSGAADASASAGVGLTKDVRAELAASASRPPEVTQGVVTSSGVTSGTGLGGGLAGGQPALGPGTTSAFAAPGQGGLRAGYLGQASAGASVQVGGAPSAFALVPLTGNLSDVPPDGVVYAFNARLG